MVSIIFCLEDARFRDNCPDGCRGQGFVVVFVVGWVKHRAVNACAYDRVETAKECWQ
jgi:hypothetical protein